MMCYYLNVQFQGQTVSADSTENRYRMAQKKTIIKLYMKQSAKLKLDQVKEEVWRQREESENNAVYRRF